MDITRFEELVSRAAASLPEEFAGRLENVDVVVQDRPDAAQLRQGHLKRGYFLLGLYEGVPLTERGQGYGLVPPDKITIFKHSIEAVCENNEALIEAEIAKTVRHEIAHYFGISDARLDEIEREKDKRKSQTK
jgi:predicted Zn-dependent protease with MMP-like domain